MKTFDIKRFAQVARWDMMTNWKVSLRTGLSMSVGLFLLYETHMFQLRNTVVTSSVWESVIRSMMFETNACYAIFMLVAASLLFVNTKTREQRTAFLMLPASCAEKFVTRLLYVTVGYSLMFIAASVVADLLQMLCCAVIGPHKVESIVWAAAVGLFGIITDLFVTFDKDTVTFFFYNAETSKMAWMAADMLTMCMAIHAFFIFGGSLFRRHAPLATFLIGIVLMFVLISTDNFPYIGRGIVGRGNFNHELMIYVYPFIYGGLTVLFYWGAYRLFCRMESINNKWLNL